jgi:hypothetical protein
MFLSLYGRSVDSYQVKPLGFYWVSVIHLLLPNRNPKAYPDMNQQNGHVKTEKHTVLTEWNV